MRRVAAILVTLAALVACGGADQASGPLTVYSGRSEDLVGPLVDRFIEESGIDVEVRYGESPELAATILTEGGSSPADLFYAQDPGSLGRVALDGLFAPLPEAVLGRVDPAYRDDAGRWVGTSGRVRVVAYNADEVGTPDLPQDLDDLTDPKWSGAIGIAPTNGSFLSFVAAMILSEGEEATRAWLEGLAANQPVSFPDNGSIVSAVDAGEIRLGLVNHYYLLRLRAEQGDTTAENLFLPGAGPGTLIMPAGAGVLASSDQPEEATRFIEFLLTEQSQQYFVEETFEYPLVEGVEPGAGLVPLDELAAPDLDLSQLATVLDLATELVTEAGLV